MDCHVVLPRNGSIVFFQSCRRFPAPGGDRFCLSEKERLENNHHASAPPDYLSAVFMTGYTVRKIVLAEREQRHAFPDVWRAVLKEVTQIIGLWLIGRR